MRRTLLGSFGALTLAAAAGCASGGQYTPPEPSHANTRCPEGEVYMCVQATASRLEPPPPPLMCMCQNAARVSQ
jgi:hypothetical protein